MRKIYLLVFLFFLCNQIVFSQHFWDVITTGPWKGSGTLLGSEAEFMMNWQSVLENQFLKLEFQNKRTSDNGDELILTSHAYYQIKSDSLFKGTWFDSRGITFPVRGILKDSTFTVNWGSPETEQGKTIYTLTSEAEVTVTDFFLKETTYVKFGEAIYQQR